MKTYKDDMIEILTEVISEMSEVIRFYEINFLNQLLNSKENITFKEIIDDILKFRGDENILQEILDGLVEHEILCYIDGFYNFTENGRKISESMFNGR